jgi:Ca2+-binding EF-hand superfamily protein
MFNECISRLKGVEFTSPELECLFKHLDQNKDGHIDFTEWSAKIYEDSSNSLALI